MIMLFDFTPDSGVAELIRVPNMTLEEITKFGHAVASADPQEVFWLSAYPPGTNRLERLLFRAHRISNVRIEG